MSQDQTIPPCEPVHSLPIGPFFKKIFKISTESFNPQDRTPRVNLPELQEMSAIHPRVQVSDILPPEAHTQIEPIDLDFFKFLVANWDPSSSNSGPSSVAMEDILALFDELVSMALPLTALTLVHLEPSLKESHSFAPQLGIGVAAMMVRDLKTAEAAFRKAQSLIPEEPAPYVNLIQIFMETGRYRDVDLWMEAGLEAAPNHHNLWELLYQRVHTVHGDFTPEKILEEARTKGSWAGVSLATSLLSTGDRHLKSRELERFYSLGERDPLFLIELTGAYGVGEEFEKIPPIVWQAQKMNSKTLPWQLHAHGAQAELSLGSPTRAQVHIDLARKDRFISKEGLQALAELESELVAQ